jgi:hypothetical protein
VGIGAGLGVDEISLSPGFDPRTVLPITTLFLKNEVFGVKQCRKLLWYCLTMPILRYGGCYLPDTTRHDLAVQQTCCSATPPRDPQIFVLFIDPFWVFRDERFGGGAR